MTDQNFTIEEWQKRVNDWIQEYGVRYFSVQTNTLLLMEELGEFSRIIARKYGEQSYKNPPSPSQEEESLQDEIADMLFVLTCLANQMDINLTEALQRNLEKKTTRDHDRHKNNTKLR